MTNSLPGAHVVSRPGKDEATGLLERSILRQRLQRGVSFHRGMEGALRQSGLGENTTPGITTIRFPHKRVVFTTLRALTGRTSIRLLTGDPPPGRMDVEVDQNCQNPRQNQWFLAHEGCRGCLSSNESPSKSCKVAFSRRPFQTFRQRKRRVPGFDLFATKASSSPSFFEASIGSGGSVVVSEWILASGLSNENAQI